MSHSLLGHRDRASRKRAALHPGLTRRLADQPACSRGAHHAHYDELKKSRGLGQLRSVKAGVDAQDPGAGRLGLVFHEEDGTHRWPTPSWLQLAPLIAWRREQAGKALSRTADGKISATAPARKQAELPRAPQDRDRRVPWIPTSCPYTCSSSAAPSRSPELPDAPRCPVRRRSAVLRRSRRLPPLCRERARRKVAAHAPSHGTVRAGQFRRSGQASRAAISWSRRLRQACAKPRPDSTSRPRCGRRRIASAYDLGSVARYLVAAPDRGAWPRVRRQRCSAVRTTGRLVRADRPGASWSGPLFDDPFVTGDQLRREPGDASGLIAFCFSCYTGGCPQFDAYTHHREGRRASWPKAVRRRAAAGPARWAGWGRLSVIAHADRAWSLSFCHPARAS